MREPRLLPAAAGPSPPVAGYFGFGRCIPRNVVAASATSLPPRERVLRGDSYHFQVENGRGGFRPRERWLAELLAQADDQVHSRADAAGRRRGSISGRQHDEAPLADGVTR